MLLSKLFNLFNMPLNLFKLFNRLFNLFQFQFQLFNHPLELLNFFLLIKLFLLFNLLIHLFQHLFQLFLPWDNSLVLRYQLVAHQALPIIHTRTRYLGLEGHLALLGVEDLVCGEQEKVDPYHQGEDCLHFNILL